MRRVVWISDGSVKSMSYVAVFHPWQDHAERFFEELCVDTQERENVLMQQVSPE